MGFIKLGRPVGEVEKAQELLESIKRDWDVLVPEELADKIVDFEAKVAALPEGEAIVKKLKKEAAHLHFQFVFPISLELENKEFSFAHMVRKLGKEIFDSQSLSPFQELNEVQQQEVLEIALGRGK